MNSKIQKWKEKAISRRKENESNKKRIQEITLSRNNWKRKYKEQQALNKVLLKELKRNKSSSGVKIRHHTYTTEFIRLSLHLRTLGGCSLRGCLRVVQVLILVLDLDLRVPSASSIRNWEMKMGHYKIRQKWESLDSDWVLIIDESISVGSQKILLLLGVNLKIYDFKSPLCLSDVEVLEIKIQKSWRAEQIDEVIQGVIDRNYHFRYCCSDNGNNLRKVLKMNNLVHIEDCGHSLGKILEKKYKKAQVYLDFCKEKSLFQKRNLLSKYAVFLPPKQRVKGRYMNLGTTVKWSFKVLELLKRQEQKKEKPDFYEHLKWILSYEDFIGELYKEQTLVDKINQQLKSNGLSKETIEKIEVQIQQSEVESKFIAQIRDYLTRNIAKISQDEPLVCSSDVIESMFGKFKNSLGDNSMAGLTQGSLAIANYGKKFSNSMIKQAMEETKIVDIEQWRKENLPVSFQQKRNRLFKKTG